MRKISEDRKDFFKLVRQLQIQEAQSTPHRLHKQYAPRHAEWDYKGKKDHQIIKYPGKKKDHP